jgi:hypothetical protein
VDGIPLLDPLSHFIGKLHAWHHRDDPDKTSNDKLHLELLGEIIPKFPAEAARRGLHLEPVSLVVLAGLGTQFVDRDTSRGFLRHHGERQGRQGGEHGKAESFHGRGGGSAFGGSQRSKPVMVGLFPAFHQSTC